MQDIRDAIHAYVLEHHLPGEPSDSLRDQTRLVSSGILDSLAVVDLICLLKKDFGVELTASDTSLDDFDRLVDIARIADQKRSQGEFLKKVS